MKGTRVWSAQALEQIAESPFPRFRIPGGWSNQSREVYDPRGRARTGISTGSLFDPVVPIRILAPRNGVGNGQAVLSDPDGLRAVSASVTELKGPDGPLPTVRLQMIRESLQDFEARLTILQALAKLPAEAQKAHRILLDDLPRRMGIGRAYLSQMELNHEWLGHAARVYRAAEELSGVKTEASWDNPPK